MIKKITLISSVAVCISSSSFAQEQIAATLRFPTQKGTALVGSNILLAQASSSDVFNDQSISYNIGLSPRLGYFIKDNLALGIDLNMGISGYTRSSYLGINTGIGIFGRYYFGKAADKNGVMNKLRFFVEAGGGYGHVFSRYPDGNDTISFVSHFDHNVFNLHIMPGVNYFVNRNVAIEAGLNYSYTHSAVGIPRYNENIKSLNLNLGLQFFFKKR